MGMDMGRVGLHAYIYESRHIRIRNMYPDPVLAFDRNPEFSPFHTMIMIVSLFEFGTSVSILPGVRIHIEYFIGIWIRILSCLRIRNCQNQQMLDINC